MEILIKLISVPPGKLPFNAKKWLAFFVANDTFSFLQQSPNDCKDIPNETLKTQLSVPLLAQVTMILW